MDYLATVDNAIANGLELVGSDLIGVSGKVLKPRNAGKGYRAVLLHNGEKYVNVYVHKIVYYLGTGDKRAFDPEWEIHHKDEDRTNNSLDNLALLPAREHESLHARLNTRNAKIDYRTAESIRDEYRRGGVSQRALANKYNLSQQHISDIVRDIKWGLKVAG